MKRNAILGLVLCLALGASYLSWSDTDTTGGASVTDVAIFQAGERDVNMITWESPTQSVVATRRTDAKGDYTWVTVTEKPAPAPSEETPPEDASDDQPAEGDAEEPSTTAPTDVNQEPAEPDAEDAPEPIVTSFVGNDVADKLWKNMSPLRALRALPDPRAMEGEVLAFAETATTLTLGKELG